MGPMSARPAAASATMTGTTPSAALRDVASASVPTVSGARTTANELTATTRPLASAARSGARPTASDAHRKQIAEPDAHQRQADQHRRPSGRRRQNRKPGRRYGERTCEQPRRTVAARQLATERPSDQHATEVTGHQRDRGVGRHACSILDEGRTPSGDAPFGGRGTEQHCGRDPEHGGKPSTDDT